MAGTEWLTRIAIFVLAAIAIARSYFLTIGIALATTGGLVLTMLALSIAEP